METQKITLTLSKNTIQKLKVLALHRNSSVLHLLIKAIEKMIDEETSYEEAHIRQILLMRKGLDLGFEKPVDRDGLHER